MKLNLGCGEFPLHGYVNVDLHSEQADIRGDFTKMTFFDVEEIEMSHILEHISWQRTHVVLLRIRSWMASGGCIRVEVPDMTALFALGTNVSYWQAGIYGIQDRPGEFHVAGFTEESLRDELEDVGFVVESSRAFLSDHPSRIGFPCVEVVALANDPDDAVQFEDA